MRILYQPAGSTMKNEGEAVKNGRVSAIHGVARPGVYHNRGYIIIGVI